MKKHLITLLALSASLNCFGMSLEKKEVVKKAVINRINHQNTVNRTTFSDQRYITFGVNTIGAEIYDMKTRKIVKTVDKLTFGPGSPLLSKYTPSIMAFERKLENTYVCSLYNLEKDTELSFKTADPFIIIGSNYFVQLGEKLLTCLENAKGYNVYDIQNNKPKNTTFEEAMHRYNLSRNKNYLAIQLKNNMLFLGDIANNETELVSSNSAVFTFRPDSKVLACFDRENSLITLYDTKNHQVITQQRTKDPIIEIKFPTNTLLFFSPDRQNYTVWDIENNTFTQFDLGAKRYPRIFEEPLKNFMTFFIPREDHRVYNFTTQKLITLKENGWGSDLIFNNDETYAAYTTTSESLAVLYETTEWKKITSIAFEGSNWNPGAFFSPCGQFLAVVSIDSKLIKFYDINNDTILFEASWIPQSEFLQFHNNDLIIFKTHDTLLMVYDYRNNRIAKIDTKETITSYAAKGELLTVSAGTETTFYTISELESTTYKKEETIITESKNNTITENEWLKKQENMQFYTHEIAACQSDKNTITLYNHTTNKKVELKREETIVWFDINDNNLIISYDTSEERIDLQTITFEDCIQTNNKGYSCIIL